MTSVWKRLQRVGKKASKFQFTASYQSLTVECTRGGKWQPNKLVVVWTRRKRRKVTKPVAWQPGISNPFRGIIVWPEPDPIEITVTLYKDSKPASQFEDKEWTFVIEDESQSGRRKPIASGAINMVDYASGEYRTFDVQLTLKLASKKLVSASLDFTLSCVLIKEGMATDEDMISLGSMLSLNENYCLDNDDSAMEVEPSPKFHHKRNLSHGSLKIQAINEVQESDGVRRESPTASPVAGREKKKRGRIRSKSSVGENKTLITELQKEDSLKRLSIGSDASFDASDTQELTRDKSKMESELIKWARSRTKGYRGVKVRNMTTSWKDGLAFCAILHSFEPEKVDFASLDSHKVKQNNKLAFAAFEKLGIPRLLDPTQMMLTSVPDKLSVMTYVYQIKAHFSRQTTVSPSSNRKEATASKQTPGMSDVNLTDAPLRSTVDAEIKESTENDTGEGFNPFLDDEENTADSEAAGVLHEVDESGDNNSIAEKEKSTETTIDTKTSLQEPSSQSKEDLVKSKPKAPPKPPRLYPDSKNPPVGDSEPNSTGVVPDNSTVESSGQNPFDEVSDVEASSTSGDINGVTKLVEKPSEGYNPFDEDDDVEDESQGKSNDGYNPFEQQDVAQAENDVDKKSPKDSSSMIKRTVSYPHGFNPFEEELNSESIEIELQDDVSEKQSSQTTVTKSYNPFDDDADADDDDEDESQSTNDRSTSNSGNPFDDDNDEDENVVNQGNALRTDARSKSSGENVSSVAKSRVRSPPDFPKSKTPDGNMKKRRAPPPPSSRSLEDPWTAKLPEDTAARRRRPAKTTKTRDQQALPSSPARMRPKRPAPAPPRRPPLIPTFDEWKSSAGADGSITGSNERTSEVSGSEDSLSSKQSTESADKTTSTDRASPGATASNPADIKLLARQVLMDARRKAGASGSLPRERVAKISREEAQEEGSEAAKNSPDTSKRKQNIISADKAPSSESLGPNGPTFSKRATDSEKDGTLQDKSKEEDRESATKRANLKLRKDELQRRKKANEKAQKIAQTAVAMGKSETAPPSTEGLPVEQTRTEETKNQGKDISETDASDAAGDKKVAGNKNLEHRPLKLKDKENSDSTTGSKERKPSTEQHPEAEKSGYKESEELQRIRAILNQGKPSTGPKKTPISETHRTQSSEGSVEVKKTFSDTKQPNYAAVNGVSTVRTPKPLPRLKDRGPNAGIEAYVESRKINFQGLEVPPVETQQNGPSRTSLDKSEGINDEDAAVDDKEMGLQKDPSLDSEDQESQDQTPVSSPEEFQNKSDHLRRELKSLEEEQEALDRVGGKLEMELRRAMQCKGCEDEQERLMQDWFLLVNKKNELVRRQAELNLMKNEEDLERSHLMLQRELRALLEMKECEKTGEQRKREQELIEQLVSVVNKRDELVQFEDTHLQQAEQDAVHLQSMMDSVKIPKDKGDCVLQ